MFTLDSDGETAAKASSIMVGFQGCKMWSEPALRFILLKCLISGGAGWVPVRLWLAALR